MQMRSSWEAHAEDYRTAAAAYDVTSIADVIQAVAKRLGASIAPGSPDEHVAGKEILLTYAQSCDETAAKLRAQGRMLEAAQSASPDITEMVTRIVAALAQALPAQPGADIPVAAPVAPTPPTDVTSKTKTPVTELLKVVEDPG